MAAGPKPDRGLKPDRTSQFRRGARALPLSSSWELRQLGSPLAIARLTLTRLIDQEIDRRTGFLWLPVAFGLGIILYFAAETEPSLIAGSTLSLLLAALTWRLQGSPSFLMRYGLCIALGFTAATWRTLSVQTPMIDRLRIVEVTGFIETLESQPGRQRLLLRPASIEGLAAESLPFRLRIGIPGSQSAEPGHFIKLKARLMPPADPALPGGYDFRREAYFRSVGGVGFALGKLETMAVPKDPPFDLVMNATIDRWRNALTTRIARAIGGEAGALSAALVTGKRGLIPEQTNENLRASGLYHIVSISGLHMVLAAGIFLWLTRAALAAIPSIALHHPIKKYAAIIAMIGATFYCVFSGSDVATERSLIMTLVMLGAILFDRPALAMRNLAMSALIVLAREPETLLGPSFQMSYAAVAALIAANRIYSQWRAGREPAQRGFVHGVGVKLLLAFAGIAATTLVATLATAPFSAFHFHRLNPLGLIGNSLAIPLVSLVVMPSAVAGTLLIPFGLDGMIWRLMGQGVEGVLFVADRVAAMENAIVAFARTGLWPFALMILALLLLTCLQTRLRWSAALALLAAIITLRMAPLPDLVVNQDGSMALLRTGEGYRLLSMGAGNRFTLSQWLPALGDNRAPNDPSLKAGIRCDSQGCIGTLKDGRVVALSARPETLRDDCAIADILISSSFIPAFCGETKKALGRAHFQRYGATLIHSAQASEWTIETTLNPDLPRPWRHKNDGRQKNDEGRNDATKTVISSPATANPTNSPLIDTESDPGLLPANLAPTSQ